MKRPSLTLSVKTQRHNSLTHSTITRTFFSYCHFYCVTLILFITVRTSERRQLIRSWRDRRTRRTVQQCSFHCASLAPSPIPFTFHCPLAQPNDDQWVDTRSESVAEQSRTRLGHQWLYYEHVSRVCWPLRDYLYSHWVLTIFHFFFFLKFGVLTESALVFRYTGTEVCNDPVRKISTILLTNRCYPDDSSTSKEKIHRARQMFNNAVRDVVDGLLE